MTATSALPETIIREVWPSVTASPAAAGLARACYKTVILAPIGFAVLLPAFAKRFLGAVPGLSGMSLRYRVTTKRVAVVSGSMGKSAASDALPCRPRTTPCHDGFRAKTVQENLWL